MKYLYLYTSYSESRGVKTLKIQNLYLIGFILIPLNSFPNKTVINKQMDKWTWAISWYVRK